MVNIKQLFKLDIFGIFMTAESPTIIVIQTPCGLDISGKHSAMRQLLHKDCLHENPSLLMTWPGTAVLIYTAK